MDVEWKDGRRKPWVFLNPEIEARSEAMVTGEEGCLSIPGLSLPVTRAAEVTLRWTGLDGGTRSRGFDGFAAICVQHEMDHLDGVVTLDHLAEEARAEALARYRA
jgi:peptide deformylase